MLLLHYSSSLSFYPVLFFSYGDKFDVDAINRHKLTPKLILDKQGKISEGKYKDLKIKEARKKILEDLKNKNLITEQKNISHVVNVHDKCGTPIEFVTTEQWFIKILDKKEKFIEQGNKIKWYPEFMHKRYDNWVKGLQWDWCISRQIYFGIPFPVWYCKDCDEVILANKEDLPVDPIEDKPPIKKCKCGRGLPVIKNISGRVTDNFVKPDGGFVHGEFFTHLFYDKPGIDQFQVVQEKKDLIVIRIKKSKEIDKKIRYQQKSMG